jgi:hypothetical protein
MNLKNCGDYMEYVRNCPKCNKELKTTNKYYFNKAVLSNSPCLSCSQKGKVFSEEHREKLKQNHADIRGEKNPFYKKKHSDETKKKISDIKKEYFSSEEVRVLVSERQKKYYKTHDNPFKGKKHSEETKNNLSQMTQTRMQDESVRELLSEKSKEWHKYNETPFKGKQHTDENKKIMGEKRKLYYSKFGHPWTGKKHKDESKFKMKKSWIRRIENGTLPFVPTYNPKSIDIIESYGKENGYTFRHAENGGEYNVPNTGFFVDGYDEKNNVVIEFDERRHRMGNNPQLDKLRQDKIGEILKCKFIRIYEEDGTITEFDYSKK